MDKKNIAYWIATVLTVVALGGSGVMQLLKPPELVANMERLGYPLYVMSLMGVFKIAGVITIAVPKLPRLKEWAYAGIFINMVGGAYSHVASKDPIGEAVPVMVILIFALTSLTLRPESRRLAGPAL